MKKAITVIGIEADGVRGLRLEQNGAGWDVALREFWPIAAGGGAQPANDDGSQPDGTQDAPDGETPPADRYEATVAALQDAAKRFGTHEVVLSLPLASLLVKVSRTSVEDRDRIAEEAGEELGKVSPFPDETPVTSVETVKETETDLVSVFAALPEAGSAEIGDALDEAGIRVVRTDIAALGWLRALWPRIFREQPSADMPSPSRKVVLMNLDEGWDVVVLDDGVPSLIRGLGSALSTAEIGREVTLSLLRAGGGADIGEMAVFAKAAVDDGLVERLTAFAPVRVELLDGEADGEAAFGGVEGVARRTQEGAALDVTPSEWVELRSESRFRKKLLAVVAAAGAGWLLLMGVLFGVPFVYGQMTDHQKTLSKRHAKAYAEVKEMRDKVRLVQQYSDHARGSLEMLKAVSDRMPAGIKLTSLNYRRGERLSLVGEAGQPTEVYEFKNALAAAATEDDEKLFASVNLTGPSQSKGGVHKFSIECLFEAEEGK